MFILDHFLSENSSNLNITSQFQFVHTCRLLHFIPFFCVVAPLYSIFLYFNTEIVLRLTNKICQKSIKIVRKNIKIICIFFSNNFLVNKRSLIFSITKKQIIFITTFVHIYKKQIWKKNPKYKKHMMTFKCINC